jgi:prolipoprotein diacylglyceryltransferase
MGKWFKTVVWTLVLAFAIYYLYTRPEAAADFVKSIFGIFDSIGRFFNSLVN